MIIFHFDLLLQEFILISNEVIIQWGRSLITITAAKGSANERTVTLPLALSSIGTGAIACGARTNGFIAQPIGIANNNNTELTIRLFNCSASGNQCAGFFWNFIGF